MVENPTQISAFLDGIFRYGALWVYVALFAACFIENIFPPFPGDSFIAAAGGLVALERLDFVTTTLIILAGGISSVMLLYLFGTNYGRKYFEKKNFKYFSAKDIEVMESKLQKWGAFILVFSRFMVGIRAAVAVAAGIGRYPTILMLFYSTVSYFLFTVLIIFLAISTVENLEVIKSYFLQYNLIIWPIIIVLAAGYFLKKYLFFKRASQ
ncbi:MAG: DedA family protein [Candidatus Zixiibacteriota bacterium]